MTHSAEVINLASVKAKRERIRRQTPEGLVVSGWLLASMGLGVIVWVGAWMIAMGMWGMVSD